MLLLAVTALDAAATVATPLMLGIIIDDAIIPRRSGLLVVLTLITAGLFLVDTVATYVQTWSSSRIGQGLVYHLRTKAFKHIQQQPLAFFTRSQTGSLISRLNNDVIGAQQALTTLLSQTTSTVLTLLFVFIALFFLSWQIAIIALVVVPLIIIPGRAIGTRLQRLARERMQLDAELSSMMNERFNVAGAVLSKLYGRPDDDAQLFSVRAGKVRDVAISTSVYGRALPMVIGLIAGFVSVMIYGIGGSLAIDGAIKVGTVVAMSSLIYNKLYGPVTQLTNIQVNYLTALVSFDRIFEILDLKPLIVERIAARPMPDFAAGEGAAPGIEFDQVRFRYPAASKVSLASLESLGSAVAESSEETWALRGVSFRAPPGKLTALVGPSGAGKTTITYLVPRLFDPNSGVVSIGGNDVRDVSLQSLHTTVGVVTQDVHLFHDSVRANLAYARPDASEPDLIEACKAAQIWDLISSLPDGLDTVAGDRGYRFSGGEKQRIALARLLLKAPPVVVLDEATAHLDAESEAAIQHALRTALAGRTSLVIAHRLSTIREADQILVINDGQVVEQGTHEELLAANGMYAGLYRTQFAPQSESGGNQDLSPVRGRAR